MKATTLLCNQHRTLERLLERIGHQGDRRMQLILELVEELLMHLSMEDHHFLGIVGDKVGIPVESHREEHARLRNALLQAVFAEMDERVFEERLRELWSLFRQHVRVLERDLLPLVDSQLRPEELDRIGAKMQVFWRAAVGGSAGRATEAHGHAAE